MPSTPTPRLRVETQALGENLNTWGDAKLNDALRRLEEGIAGLATIAITGPSTTLTSVNYSADQARNACLVFTGTLTSASTVTVPNVEKLYLVVNLTGGAFGLTIKTAAGAGTALRGGPQWVRCDGTDVHLATPRLDQSPLPTAPVDLNGQRLTGLGTPTAASDAVPKSYSDAIAGSASQAASSAASASTSASQAATSAGQAATSASQAASSATSAATSAAAAASKLPLSGGTVTGNLEVTGWTTTTNLTVTDSAWVKILNVGPETGSEGGQINLLPAPGQTGASIDTLDNGSVRIHTLPSGKLVQIIQADGSTIELRPDEFSAFPQLRLKGAAFKYLECESPHFAFIKATGGYSFYWRRSDTGRRDGGGMVNMMALDDTGLLTLGGASNTGFVTTDRSDWGRTWAWYASGGAMRFYSSSTGDNLRVEENGHTSTRGNFYANNGANAVWHNGNFDPATKQAAGSYLGGNSVSGSSIGWGSAAGPELLGVAGGAAAITLHRPGSYAVNFGLEVNNELRIGGYSMGAVSYRVLHEGIVQPLANRGVGTYVAVQVSFVLGSLAEDTLANGTANRCIQSMGGGVYALTSAGHVGGDWYCRGLSGMDRNTDGSIAARYYLFVRAS